MKRDTFASSAQRRQSERISCEIPGIAVCDTGLRIPFKTLDLSQDGARLRLHQPIRKFPGHTLEQLQLNGVGQLFVNLRWIRDREMGVRFDHADESELRLRDLLDELHVSAQRMTGRRAASQRAG
ncbi:MAG: PilZ domain-containing protein [Pelagimonas sp.]|jgi:hypothetical protein|nr:PilZ domain-containing protein [Pelagimonas sp.]